ncbi:DUF1616 domain-containing protein [Dictyobacter formicarum]|uniref:DUF1616 domain-containing protein n=1 Tax=Dictyobacter formicarum TaxID=2778368 RepID=A0ABQ3VBJ0_9CHLR|nr:DUF1616 domain-containing protein [Dictyobacter formicarum]GHO83173.1 hypothetical protein KSZ_11790 [Dictyobacter formicarum]
MRQKNIDLLLIMAAVIANILWAVFPSLPHFIGIIIALPIVLFIPGYLLCEVMFQQRMPGVYHRLAFSLALSLAIVILSGFALNVLSTGLNLVTWTLLLDVFNTVFCLGSFLLRGKAQIKNSGARRIHFAVHDYIFLVLAIIVVAVSFQYSTNSILHQSGAGYTQLWMLPSQVDRNNWTINLGMQSEETTVKQYKLLVMVNGKPFKTWSSVSLAPKSIWKQQVSLTPDKTGKVDASARLYLVDAPQAIYREVHVTLQRK